MDDVI